MRKLQGPDDALPKKSEGKSPFPKKETLIDSRYDNLRGQLACVERQLGDAFRKRERLEEYSECAEQLERFGGCNDWVRYQSAVHSRDTIMSEMKPEAFSVGMGIFAKNMLWITAAVSAALLPIVGLSEAAITPKFLYAAIGIMALVAIYHTKRRISEGAPDIVEQLSLRVEERIVDLEKERKVLTKKIFGMNPGKSDSL